MIEVLEKTAYGRSDELANNLLLRYEGLCPFRLKRQSAVRRHFFLQGSDIACEP